MKFRRLTPLLALAGALTALLAPTGSGSLAASTAPFRLRADMLPTACNITLDGNGQVDFGVVRASQLSDTNFTKFPARSLALNITCDTAAQVAISIADGRAGTAVPGMGSFFYWDQDDASTFGLGSVDGRNIGAYLVYRTSNGQAGTTPVYPIVSNNNGGTWVTGTGSFNAITPTRLHSWSNTAGGAPGSLVTVTQTYFVEMGLNRKTGLPKLDREIPIDGLATFTIQYL